MTIEEIGHAQAVLKDKMSVVLDMAENESDAEKREALLATFDKQSEEMKALEASMKRHKYLEAQNERLSAAVPIKSGLPVVDEPKALKGRPRYGKLLAYKPGTHAGQTAAEVEETAYSMGRWLSATMWHNDSSKRWCEERGIVIRAAQSEGVGSAGGVLVPDQMAQSIIDLQEVYGVARSWCDVFPMSSDHATIPRRTGGLTAYAVGENSLTTESDLTFDNVGLTAKKWMTLTRYSSELSEDAFVSIADRITREAAIAFAYAEDNALFNGTGAASFHGIQGIVQVFGDGSNHAGAIDAASTTSFASITAAQLASLMAICPIYALPNAAFYVSQQAFSNVFERLAQASGGVTKAEFTGATRAAYQGYPVVVSPLLPTSGANNQVMVLFGDLSLSTTMGVRRGVTMASSSDRYFDQDQIAIRGTERFDINVHDLGSSTANDEGPLVALIGAS